MSSVRISLALCTFRSKNFALFLQRKDTHYSPILQSLEEKYPFVSVCQRSLSKRSLKERVEYRSESPDLNPDLNNLALPSYAMVTFSAVTSPTCNSTLPRVPLSANRSSRRNNLSVPPLTPPCSNSLDPDDIQRVRRYIQQNAAILG